jgi:hypothetical protein
MLKQSLAGEKDFGIFETSWCQYIKHFSFEIS